MDDAQRETELIVAEERRYQDFYQRLRRRVAAWKIARSERGGQVVDAVMLAPDMVHLLIRLVLDRRVPRDQRTRLAGALAYFMAPLDLMPEVFMGPAGYVDDVVVAAAVLHTVMETIDEELVASHWAGQERLLDTLRSILGSAEELVGSGMWEKIRRLLGMSGGRLRR